MNKYSAEIKYEKVIKDSITFKVKGVDKEDAAHSAKMRFLQMGLHLPNTRPSYTLTKIGEE